MNLERIKVDEVVQVAGALDSDRPPIQAWRSRRGGRGGGWIVQEHAYGGAVGTPFEGVRLISVGYRSDWRFAESVVASWSTVQALKERLFPGTLAIELYPREPEVVNIAPVRWLWLLPKGCALPLSIDDLEGGGEVTS